ncbi:tetrathionate reductase family octaheme c-type cytochrome [uncultured Desulfuromonas sp.]|uniref:tetrathionate reductase family octaheme c-type cytochrome n=1 Tax=uncultured Desulfuromonas sp. TaxID=181013 RepID=UPI00262F7E7F|nr:tetrathionate reductase family octaheme c-type cytochrome [uncultured Desulfuromonas sp.]
MSIHSRKWLLATLVAAFICLPALPGLAAETDHTGFVEGPFTTGPEVTKQCLECHEDAATDVMKTSHWTWALEQKVDGKTVARGKKNAINNFCISVTGNWPRCTSCHAGYGWTDNDFDFNDKTKVDCLVCHDTTGTYVKEPTGAGNPAKSVDLLRVAQNVGKPVRDNCGACHFFGGGGDAVKHGDLDSSMAYPDRTVDVHMDAEGNDFQCQACHEPENHLIPGNSLGVSPGGENHFGCEKCHDASPHKQTRLNTHAATVACQTCHIPAYAKEIPTKLEWDWSTAGQNLEGEHKDEYGKHTYMKKKGHFKWGKNVTPEYAWYNGSAGAYLPGDKMDPDQVTKLSYPLGSKGEKNAKIYPFKVHRGKQIYDSKNNVFITAKVFGKGGYWKTFDWDQAAKLGMESNPIMKEKGISYSGSYGFAATEMYWRLNHMVAPEEQALGCLDCHGDNGRLDWKALGYKADPMDDRSPAKN